MASSITSRNRNRDASSVTSNEHSKPSDSSRPQTTPGSTQFVRARQGVHDAMEDPKPAIMELISWILTLQVFFISAIWYLTTLPIRISAYFYEHHIRALFPDLPSVRQLLVWLRSVVLTVLPDPGPDPAGTSSGAGPNPLPTLNVNLDAIRAGGT